MIIGKMLPDEVVANWEVIKFAVVTVNNITDGVEKYCINILASLLAGKYQCWAGVSDDRSTIQGIAITRLYKDIGDTHFLLIDTMYVYEATELQDRLLFIDTVKKFGKQLEYSKILFFTSNPSIVNIANRLGFVEVSRLFTMDIGG